MEHLKCSQEAFSLFLKNNNLIRSLYKENYAGRQSLPCVLPWKNRSEIIRALVKNGADNNDIILLCKLSSLSNLFVLITWIRKPTLNRLWIIHLMNLLQALARAELSKLLETNSFTWHCLSDTRPCVCSYITTASWGCEICSFIYSKHFGFIRNRLSLIIVYVLCICSHMELFFGSRWHPMKCSEYLRCWHGIQSYNTDADDRARAKMEQRCLIVYLGGTCNAVEL